MRSNKRRTVFVIAPVPESVSHPNPTPLIVIISSCKPTQNKVNLETGDKRVTAPEGDIDWERVLPICVVRVLWYCGALQRPDNRILRQANFYIYGKHSFFLPFLDALASLESVMTVMMMGLQFFGQWLSNLQKDKKKKRQKEKKTKRKKEKKKKRKKEKKKKRKKEKKDKRAKGQIGKK